MASSDPLDSACVRSESVRAACDVCGESPSVVHFPRESHGHYCAACCPVCAELAELARIYFGGGELDRIERLAKDQAEGEFRERLHLAAFQALQTITGDLNPSATIPDDKRAAFYAEFARRVSNLLSSEQEP